MRVFSSFENRPASQSNVERKAKKKSNKINRVKKTIPPKENLSASEIKARLEKGLNKSGKANKPKSFVTHDEMRLKTEDAISKAKELGAIDENKPDSELTRSKLKDSLSSGSFAFSDKERAVLSQILGS